jgi:hypothetical protein
MANYVLDHAGRTPPDRERTDCGPYTPRGKTPPYKTTLLTSVEVVVPSLFRGRSAPGRYSDGRMWRNEMGGPPTRAPAQRPRS